MFRSIGLITIQNRHLKTEQIARALLERGFDLTIYALPFLSRKKRTPLFEHRPNQFVGAHPKEFAENHGLAYIECECDTNIDNCQELYIVLGGGILSAECVEGKRILNCHPGIIPSSRGLDSFKWAIYEKKPLGVSLHYIDAEVDAGEVVSILSTPVQSMDTIETLAERHYDNEISMLTQFDLYLKNPVNEFAGAELGEARMRMPRRLEIVVLEGFEDYTRMYGVH